MCRPSRLHPTTQGNNSLPYTPPTPRVFGRPCLCDRRGVRKQRSARASFMLPGAPLRAEPPESPPQPAEKPTCFQPRCSQVPRSLELRRDVNKLNPLPLPGICMRRPSEPSMPAVAVGSAHGVVRTHRVVPRDRQSEKMRARRKGVLMRTPLCGGWGESGTITSTSVSGKLGGLQDLEQING